MKGKNLLEIRRNFWEANNYGNFDNTVLKKEKEYAEKYQWAIKNLSKKEAEAVVEFLEKREIKLKI